MKLTLARKLQLPAAGYGETRCIGVSSATAARAAKRWAIVFLIAAIVTLVAYALGWRPPDGFWVSILLGWMLTLFGVLFPHTGQNWLFGVRTPWTLENPEVWRITHEFAGKVSLVAGILCIVLGLLIDPGWAALLSVLIVIFSSLLPLDYSRSVAKRLKAGATTPGKKAKVV